MARIQTYEAGVGLDVGGAPRLPSPPARDQSYGRALQGVGAAIQGFGSDITAIAERRQQRNEQRQRFGAEQSFLRFQYGLEEDYAREKQNMPADGAGWHDGWAQRYEKARQGFLGSLPPDLQDEYRERTATLAEKWSEKSAGDEIDQTNGWYKSSIDESHNGLKLRLKVAGADALEALQAEGEKVIDESGLPPSEKEALRQKWRATAQEIAAGTLPAEERASALFGGQPEAGSIEETVAKIIGVESGGRAGAKNPRSSASGLGQFTDATWIATVRRHRRDLAGLSNRELIALKTNPTLGREMTQRLTEDNAAALRSAGAPVTEGNLYLAHFAGIGGAVKVLSADENASVSSVLGAAVVKANPFLSGKSVGWLRQWAAHKMGGAKPVAVAPDPRFGDIDFDKRLKIVDEADREVDAFEREQDRIAREGRPDVAKDGFDLLTAGNLTDEWIDQHRSDLNYSTYTTFREAVNPTSDTPIKVDPAEYLRLIDLAESNPEAALGEARTAFLEHRIDKSTLGKVYSVASSEPDRPRYFGQLRHYIDDALRPPENGSYNEFKRHLDTMFIFDDWVAENPKATRDEVHAFGDDLIRNQRRYLAEYAYRTLPLPKFADVPNNWSMNEESVQKAKQKTADMVATGMMGEAEAASEADLLKQWERAVKDYAGFPARTGR